MITQASFATLNANASRSLVSVLVALKLLTRVCGTIGVFSLVESGAARADFKVFTPDVSKGELATETVGALGSDADPSRTGEQSFTTDIEYGLTRWWQTELEVEFDRAPGSGQRVRFDQLTTENLFRFTPRGEYWIDSGFYAEYGRGLLAGSTSATTLGPLFRAEFLGLSTALNVFVEKDLGAHASGRPQLLYAAETRVDALEVKAGRHLAFEPGFQFYGRPGPIGRFASWAGQDNRAGPQLFGKVFDIGPGTLEWNGGVLVGLTSAVPRFTVRWQFEYEFHL